MDNARNAVTEAENKPVYRLGANPCKGSTHRMMTHKDQDTICVSFPVLRHLLVLFSSQLQVHRKESLQKPKLVSKLRNQSELAHTAEGGGEMGWMDRNVCRE